MSPPMFQNITQESIALLLILCFIDVCTSQRPLDANDVYTFCGYGRSQGDTSSCKGYCPDSNTRCSLETGVCSCTSTKTISEASRNYNCKAAASRTRCSNACKTFAAIESFRRPESRICQCGECEIRHSSCQGFLLIAVTKLWHLWCN